MSFSQSLLVIPQYRKDQWHHVHFITNKKRVVQWFKATANILPISWIHLQVVPNSSVDHHQARKLDTAGRIGRRVLKLPRFNKENTSNISTRTPTVNLVLYSWRY